MCPCRVTRQTAQRRAGDQSLKRGQLQSWRGGRRAGVHHAEDKFLEPQQGIWSYACQSDRDGEREVDRMKEAEGIEK
jgi:hypothetical protein